MASRKGPLLPCPTVFSHTAAALAALGLALLTLLPPAPPAGVCAAAPGREGAVSIWHHETVLKEGTDFTTLAVADFVPSVPGEESVAGGGSGVLQLVWMEDCIWGRDGPWSADGSITSIAPGELDAGEEGRELAVGVATGEGSGAVYVLSGLGRGPSSRLVHTGERPVLAVTAGRLSGDGGAPRVAAVDDGGDVWLVVPGEGSAASQRIHTVPGAGCIAAADLDPAMAGDELAVGTSGGRVLELYNDGTGWRNLTLWTSPTAVTGLAHGDADPRHAGPELLVCTEGGELILLELVGGTWGGKVIWRSGSPLRGVTVGDLHRDYQGAEAVATGESGVTVVWWSGDGWRAETVWSPGSPCGDVAVGELDPFHAGPEALVAGPAGELSLVGLYRPDILLSAENHTAIVSSGESAGFGLILQSIERLEGKVALCASGLPDNVSILQGTGQVELRPPAVGIRLELAVPADAPNGNFSLLVTAFHQAGMHSSVRLNLSIERTLDFAVALSTESPTPGAGKAITYIATVTNTGSMASAFRVRAWTDAGWKIGYPRSNVTKRLAPGESDVVPIRVSIPADAAGSTVKLTVEASPLNNPAETRTASMRVAVPGSSTCAMLILPMVVAVAALMLCGTRRA